MLSEKAKLQLQMFLNTLEKESGIKADYLQVYQHHGTEDHASKLEQQGFKMEAGAETVWASMDDIINECRFRACYFYDPEEEFEQEPFLCRECGDPVQDNSDDENAEFCNACYVHVLQVWQAENKHQKTEYRQSVL